MSISGRFGAALTPALVLLSLAGLYAIGVFSRGVWYDEAITIQSLSGERFVPLSQGFATVADLARFVTGRTTLDEVVRRYIETDVHPPLYFAIAHAATLAFENSLAVVRAVSLALVLISVGLYARVLRKAGEPMVWLAAAIWACSFAALTTAQDARPYALALPLVIAAWGLVAASPPTDRRAALGRDIAVGGLCGALLLTHYFALFVVGPLLVWHLAEALKDRRRAGLLAPATCAVLFAPWLPVMLDHLGSRPDQMAGFDGSLDWLRLTARLLAGQIFSATHFDVSASLQMAGRLAVLALIALGTAAALLDRGEPAARRRLALSAVWLLTGTLAAFLVASIVLDRWFDMLRYYLFAAPFAAYLAWRGALLIGRGLAAIAGVGGIAALPASLLVASELAMANFGWEANRNRGGAYYASIARQVADVGPDESLAIVDAGRGRGTLLSTALSLPAETRLYILNPDPARWQAAAAEIAADLQARKVVVLIHTIERGSMEADKTVPFAPIIAGIEAAGFVRADSAPVPVGARYYAKWERPDGHD